MDQNILNYIKKMFAVESTPVWSKDYEGVIFYDQNQKRWVIGKSDGWQIIDRRFQTFQELPNIEWIDPFEYDTDEYLKSKWIINNVSGSGYYSIIIDSDEIDENLTDFPIMINLSGSSGIGSFDATQIFTDLGANSKKIKVKNSSGTELYCEIEMWDDTAEKAVLHVKVDSISSSADTVLTLEWDSTWADNTTYIGVIGDSAAQNVWDSNFEFICHMAQDPSGGAGCVLDSTSNRLNSTPDGGMTSGDLVDVNYGKAIDFDGVDDNILIPDAAVLDITNTVTLEVLYYTTADKNQGLLYKGDVSDENWLDNTYSMAINTELNVTCTYIGSDPTYTDTPAPTKNQWQYLAGTYDQSNILNYLDGAAGTPVGHSAAIPTNDEPIVIGNYFQDNAYNFVGKIAEVRISSSARSAAWIKATNASLTDTLLYINTPRLDIQTTEYENTLGQYSMKIDALISGSKNRTIYREFEEPLDFTGHNVLKFDTKASRIGKNLEISIGTVVGWLGDWKYRRKITIDNTNIDSNLNHFPVPIILGNSVGQTSQDVSDIFDELNYDNVDDDFTETDGSSPNSILWDFTNNSAGGSGNIQNNKLRFSIPSTSSDEYIRIISNFKISGDFDIQVDYEEISGDVPSSSTSYPAQLQASTDNGVWVVIDTFWNTGIHRMGYDSTNTSSSYSSSLYSSGKLRITRTGTTWKVYYWSGSQWEWDGNTSGYTLNETDTSDVKIKIMSSADFDSGVTTDFDNFKINSGTIVWESHPNRKKIAITKSDGITQIYGEIEHWDSTNEKAVIWTSSSGLDILSENTTDLYLYYDSNQEDNTSYIGDTGSDAAKNVWNDNFVAVYHMNQDPSGGTDCIIDSTINENHGTPAGSMTSDDLVDGSFGKAIEFDGNDDAINCGSDSSLELSGDFTIEAIVKPYDTNANRIIAKGGTTSTYKRNYYLFSDTTVYFSTETTDDTYQSIGGGTVVPNSSIYVGGRHTGSINNIIFDGLELNSRSDISSVASETGNMYIGRVDDMINTDNFNGIIEEVRISSIYRSDEWIKATNYSINDDLLSYTLNEEIHSLPITKTINHSYKDIWQKEIINITSNNDTYDKIEFKILNDDENNTIYIDNMSFGMPDIYWIDSFEYPTDEILRNNWITVVENEIPWTPAEISTDLWLDASASGTITLDGSGNVEQWDDKSGNAHNIEQTNSNYRPVYGPSVVTFDGADDFLTLGTVLGKPSNYAIFVVTKTDNYNNMVLIGSRASDGALPSSWGNIIVDESGTGVGVWIYGDGTNHRLALSTTPLLSNTSSVIASVIHENGTQDETLYRNGTALTNTGQGGSATEISGTTYPFSIGRAGDFDGAYFDGSVYEVIVITDIITIDERQKIEGYLAHKWGLEANLPADHPYKTTAPTQEIQYYSDVIEVYTDNSSPTYGNFSLRAEAVISGSKTCGFEKTFTQDIGLKDYNSLSFDTKSNRVGENVEFNMTVNGPPDISAISNWLDGWSYRIPITIDHNKVDEDLTHFPIPITISGTTASGIFDEIGENNKKIAIATEEKIQLYGEIEQWDSSTNKICIWTSKSDFVVSSGTDTNMYFYYDSSKDDNIDYIGSAGDTSAQNVWDDNFKAVYNMAQDPSIGGACILDSTSNNNNGTPSGSMTSDDLVDNDFGKGIEFDGSDDKIVVGSDSSINSFSGAITFSSLFKPTNVDSINAVMALRNACGTDHIQMYTRTGTDALYANIMDSTSTNRAAQSSFEPVSNTWYNLVCKYDGTTLSLINNNSVIFSNTVSFTIKSFSSILNIGDDSCGNNFEGIISEIRLSNVARSDHWVKADYYAINNNLLTLGKKESIHTNITKSIHHNDLNTWQKEVIDLSSLFDTSLFYIRKIAFNILNDDLDNTFYIDNMYLSDFQPPIDEPVIIKSLSLSIDHTKIDEDLTNFPLMISLVSGTCDIFDQLAENNLKFKIETEDGTQCYTEIEDWNYSNGKACLWTKVPTVSSSVDTKLTLTYSSSFDDNISYIGTTGSGVSYNVWDDNFVAVYHMNQDPSGGTGCIIDSTINENHGTPAGSMTSDDLVDIDYGKAIDFDGSNDSIYSSFSLPEPLTVIIDIKPDSTSAFVPFCVNWDYTQDQGRLLKWDAGWKVYSGNDNNTFGGSISAGNWYRIVFTVNSSNLIEIFQNGTSLGTATRTNSGENTNNYFGSEKSSQNFFNGKISNIMCANNVLQNAWIKADYYNTINNLITIT